MSKPKEIKHIPGHKYRLCMGCGYEYNVSKYDNWGTTNSDNPEDWEGEPELWWFELVM